MGGLKAEINHTCGNTNTLLCLRGPLVILVIYNPPPKDNSEEYGNEKGLLMLSVSSMDFFCVFFCNCQFCVLISGQMYECHRNQLSKKQQRKSSPQPVSHSTPSVILNVATLGLSASSQHEKKLKIAAVSPSLRLHQHDSQSLSGNRVLLHMRPQSA